MTISDIERLFWAHKGRLIDKWSSYWWIYERYMAKFRGTDCNLLEIGVNHGGSLQLWKEYLGPKAFIWGMDIDERCLEYTEDRIGILHGDQGKAKDLELLSGPFDIILDDGSHQFSDQMTSLRCLWPKVREGGVYIVEDCHGERTEPPRDAGSVAHYPWVCVYERMAFNPTRVVRGNPSRPLNKHEIEAYGELG